MLGQVKPPGQVGGQVAGAVLGLWVGSKQLQLCWKRHLRERGRGSQGRLLRSGCFGHKELLPAGNLGRRDSE